MIAFHIRRAIALIAALCLLLLSLPALADETSDAEASGSGTQDGIDKAFNIGFDVLVLRPLGAVALVGGAALFVPAVIFTAPGGSEGVKDSLDIFVQTPWRDLAERPLGDI
ncbi:MAG: hypothetical protein VX252_16320 [Myxococcota bacterium]|nr:hypothetical protein [Myxococcota bacterium]